ncbi:MAG: hypothetical protein IPK19_27810 [Chloroflexi bacterium]|nr:hypothetical protein [Chloroflexota bacterium]
MANAKRFVRRIGLTYEELMALMQTRFINPNGSVIPKLERLGIPFAALAALKAGTLADADFLKAVNRQAPAPEPAQYGGDIKTWVVAKDNYARIMGLLVLSVPAAAWTASHALAAGDLVVPKSPGATSTLYFECTTNGSSAAAEPSWVATPGMTCSDGTVVWTCRDASDCHAIEHLAFRYSDPAKATQDIGAAEFVRIARFIRLWKKLGWSIEQTDAALCAYFREDFARPTHADLDDVAKLDQGFLTALPRIGITQRLMSALNLSVQKDVLALLANSADIDTHGAGSLYGKLFLNPSILKQDPVFADNGYGGYLTDASQRILNSKSVQKAGVSGTITVGDELVTMINGVEVRYKVVASDAMLSDLAASLAGAVNAATDKEPRSGRKLNEVVQASSVGNVLLVKALDAGLAFILTCWAAPGSTILYATRDHEAAVRAALNLTNDEFDLIADALGFTEATPLDLPNVSAVFRRAWLARKLGLSVREFLLLIQRSGINPFGIDEVANPGIFRLLRWVQALREGSLSVSRRAVPSSGTKTSVARRLRRRRPGRVGADFARRLCTGRCSAPYNFGIWCRRRAGERGVGIRQ